jgi:hypothetical protein
MERRLHFILLLAFFFQVDFILSAQTCKCKSVIPDRMQPRGLEKTVTNNSAYALKQDTITTDYIYLWQSRYHEKTKTITWNDYNKNSRRRKGTPEDSIYIVKGYLWFVWKVGFDCDYHMEVGSEDSSDTRIVMEVPHMYTRLQEKIFRHLDSLHLPILNCTTSDTKLSHFKKGIPVIIKGIGFYDAYHKPGTNHGDLHTKRYTWELHPVFDVQFL